MPACTREWHHNSTWYKGLKFLVFVIFLKVVAFIFTSASGQARESIQLAGKNISCCIPSYTCTQSVPRDVLPPSIFHGSSSINFGTRCLSSSLVQPVSSGHVSESLLFGTCFQMKHWWLALLTWYNALSSVGGRLLLSRCFLMKSLYLRWFKFEVASPYRRPINLKQTVKVSALITVQSVPRFFSPTRSSLKVKLSECFHLSFRQHLNYCHNVNYVRCLMKTISRKCAVAKTVHF